MFGLGGELAKEVDFVFMFCYYFVQAHFVMFSGLLGSLSIKLLYFTAYFFKIWTRFCNKNFLWFCLTCGLKIEALSNSIDVRLVPCLVE